MAISASRREILAAICASPALLVAGASRGQGPTTPREGVDYTVLENPQPTSSPGKIEVLDFFWYGCPHCYDFLPSLEAWRKRQPADVAVKHVPVAFDQGREPHSKIFYALQVLGKVDEMHVKVFDAIHKRHLRLLDGAEISDFMFANGIPREQWEAAYDSFTVASMVNAARMLFIAYTIDGTPTEAVDGRFLTSPSIVPSHTFADAIAVMDYLVDRVRKEHGRRRS